MSATPHTIRYSRGAVVLVPFPFTDQSATRRRPALVVSSDDYNQACPDRVLARITSQPPDVLPPGDYTLQEDDWKAAGLIAASIVRCGKLVTTETSLVLRQLGSMPAEAMAEINRYITTALALAEVAGKEKA